MENQNKKIFRWILGGGLICIFLLIPEILIAELLSKNNPEVFTFYTTIMLLITLSIYIIISVIQVIKYQKYAKKYKIEKMEEATKKLTSKFTQVVLNYPWPFSKDSFKCQAKIDTAGKIICKIQLNHEVEFENYEKFLRHFHFEQD